MFKYMLKKLAMFFGLLAVILTINFVLIRIMPGDPLENILGQENYYHLYNKNPERLEELRVHYGIDGTIGEQFVRYIKDVLRLDFGYSYTKKNSVASEVLYQMKWTVILLLPTLIISGIAGAVLGMRAGWNKGGKTDSILTVLALILRSVPGNCLAILFLIFFASELKWFPIGGMVSGGNLTGIERMLSILHHMALPMLVLILFRVSSNFLLMKSIISQVKNEEYITTAFAKGLTERQVIFRHAARNVMAPYLTSVCMQMGGIFGGAIFIEVVFSWKGLGTLFGRAMNSNDYPVLQFCFLITTVCVLVFYFISDVILGLIDPRVKGGENID